MTASTIDDLVADYRRHLPRWADHALWATKRVAHLINIAVTIRGWTPEQLAADTTAGLEHHYRPGGVITARLERDSQVPPPETKSKPRKIHNGCCDNGLIYDETTDPPTVTKCAGATS